MNMTRRWGEEYQEMKTENPIFSLKLLEKRLLVKHMIINSTIQQISIVPKMGSIISTC